MSSIRIRNPAAGMRSIFPETKRYLIIDWANFTHRAYYSTDAEKVLELLIFMLAKLRRTYSGRSIVIALEGRGRTIRSKLFPPYKANRKADSNFGKVEINCMKLLDFLACTMIKAPNGEADDAIACFTEMLQSGERAIIVSEDRDLWQLIRDDVVTVKVQKFGEINERKCLEIIGVPPRNVACLKAFLGDSDNIPRGVPRMKTATIKKLALAGTTPKEAYKRAKASSLVSEKDLGSVVKCKGQLELNYDLIRLRRNLKLLTRRNDGNREGLVCLLIENNIYGVDEQTIDMITESYHEGKS
jgi:5'-3' exonuclease